MASEENRGLWQVGQSVGINTPWAEFPTKVRWQQSLLGDFNGDQRTDILVLADLFRAAWLATSEGTYAVERAVENPFSLKGEQGSLLAADLDGDGVDDVANVHEREGKLEIEIAFRSPPPPSTLNINLLVFRSLAPLPLLDVPWWLDRQERISVSGRKEVCEFEQKNYFLALAADSGSMTLEKISFADKLSKRRTFFARDENPDPRIIGAISDFHGLRQTPAVCTGYYPEAQFPRFLKWGNQLSPCPESYAILGAEEGSREGRLRYAVDANCCPLPATDILGNEHVAVEESCPENFVMTGTLRQDESCADCPLKNRCTKINTERYQLSAARPGRYWGNGFSGRFQKERLQASDIPVGIRYGVTRTNYSDWSTDGCIGSPMGALLTKRVGKKCDDSDYRELLYRGIPGDPPAGTPVLMFPKCRKIENVFDPRSGCYPEK